MKAIRLLPGAAENAQALTEYKGFTAEQLEDAELRVVEEVQRSMKAPRHRTLLRVQGALAVDMHRCLPYKGLESPAPRQLVVGMVSDMASYGSLYDLLK